ncbi:MAG: hydrolase 1, exosortase A system-associated [Betaproteobacteria bacterium]|nr:MAG: hydrolase 1, exosortase A system-associated [Betaproteobacteria bacterium]
MMGAAHPATAEVGPQDPAHMTADLGYCESPAWIPCGEDRMLGVLCEPAAGPVAPRAVLIVVGGPQYRVGSHRQFLRLARRLARGGYVSLRFDYRGMGDSEGAARTFEAIGDDIDAAIAFLRGRSGVRSIVVWGLCDAASAALMFCAGNPHVGGLVLLNPWARSDTTLATARLKHYYGQRLLEIDFWRRLLSARFDWRASLRGLGDSLRRALDRSERPPEDAFQARMATGWRSFRGPILLVLSGRDLTAKEFLEHAAADSRWRGLLARPNVTRVELPAADHTFSRATWHAWLEERTLEWLDGMATGSER